MNNTQTLDRTAPPPRVKKSALSRKTSTEAQIGVSTSRTGKNQEQGTPQKPNHPARSIVRPHPTGGYTLATCATDRACTIHLYHGWFATRRAATRALKAGGAS